MRFSEAWLREWVNPDINTETLTHQLSMSGLEVEAVHPVAPPFSGVVVGQVLDLAPHPNADKLRVCQVAVGPGNVLQIICGAANVAAGMRVPVALVGAELPGGHRITRAKLRGVESLGMICSAQELGLEDRSEGILPLPEDAPVGMDFRRYWQLDDRAIELNLTPDRGDCLSLAGIAREVGVLNRVAVCPPPDVPLPAQDDARFEVRLLAPAACPRYACRILRGIDTQARTPQWMRERLRRSGLRAISPVVDVTNYVLLELGQPLHGFDLARLDGHIEVRMARPGERLVLLDGQDLALREDTLVIADAAGPVAMAGIMGGLASGVSAETRDILLESAFFAPLAVSGRARSYGLATDAAHRFERGVDPELQVRALERATHLLRDIVGGVAGPVVEVVAREHLPPRAPVELRRTRIRRVLGVEIGDDRARDILERLEMRVEPQPNGWRVTPPSGRFDITLEVDLIEELGRIYGYTEIPMTHAVSSTSMRAVPETRFDRERAALMLVDRGYQEVVTYSFVSPEIQSWVDPEQVPIVLANPISPDMSVMRTSLWPGLLLAAQYNRARQQGRLRLFETGLRFLRGGEVIDQAPMLAGLAMGDLLAEQWGDLARAVDFYDLKADLEAILGLGGAGVAYRYVADQHPALHPGQSARVERDGVAVGWLGMLHPELAKRLDLGDNVFLFEIALQAIQEGALPSFLPLSRFPSIRRDLAILVDRGTSYAQVRDCILAAAPEILRDISLFDVYTGANIDSGRKSLALGLILQDSLHTLTDQEVDAAVASILRDLTDQLGATLRE